MGRFHETQLAVYFDDLDPFQILHNARYLLIFERAIGEFWQAQMGWGGPLDPEGNPDQFHVVASNHMDYLRPFRGVGRVRARLTIKKLGNSSLNFRCRILPMDEDTPHAVGERVVVCIDPKTQRPKPWSASFREKVRPFLEE